MIGVQLNLVDPVALERARCLAAVDKMRRCWARRDLDRSVVRALVYQVLDQITQEIERG